MKFFGKSFISMKIDIIKTYKLNLRVFIIIAVIMRYFIIALFIRYVLDD